VHVAKLKIELLFTQQTDPEKAEQKTLSASLSFIANAHNELYAFYTGKGSSVKNFSANRGAVPPPL